MTQRALYGFSANPFLSWTLLASEIGEMTLASAQVIGQRSNRMAMAGMPPNARDQPEFALMGQEKVMAAAGSAQALTLSMMMLSRQIYALALKQVLTGAWASLAQKGLKPIHSRVTRNARRLAKR